MMCSAVSIRLALAVAVAGLFAGAADAGFSASDYGKWFHGDGTYYGWTEQGNCAFRDRPAVYRSLPAVAINHAQYADSLSCGACARYVGEGRGAGANPIKGSDIVLIHDRCPECQPGDLDFSKSGDGRWAIKFEFVPCPFDDDVSVFFEGSHKWYWKIQVRGLRYPVKSVRMKNIDGRRTQDNFFELQNDGGHRLPATVYITDVMNRRFEAVIDRMDNEVNIRPRSVKGPIGGNEPDNKPKPNPKLPKPTNKAPSPPPRRRCVPRYYRCGPRTWFKTSRCCDKKFRCMYVRSERRNKCMPHKPKKCLARFKKCGGRKQGCCSGTACRKRRGWRFHRCLPRHWK